MAWDESQGPNPIWQTIPLTFDVLQLQAQVIKLRNNSITKGDKRNSCRFVTMAATIQALGCMRTCAGSSASHHRHAWQTGERERESSGGRMILSTLSELIRQEPSLVLLGWVHHSFAIYMTDSYINMDKTEFYAHARPTPMKVDMNKAYLFTHTNEGT